MFKKKLLTSMQQIFNWAKLHLRKEHENFHYIILINNDTQRSSSVSQAETLSYYISHRVLSILL